MDVALALLILWGLLFTPPALVVHGIVLGEGARRRALPLAPLTGIALAALAFGVLHTAGIRPGASGVQVGVVAASVASVVAVRLLRLPWRSRELLGAALLVVLAAALLQIGVLGGAASGPLGYGAGRTGDVGPVEEVATIEGAALGPARGLATVRRAMDDAEERNVAYELFAGFTVGLGQDGAAATATDRLDSGERWSAYSLDSAIGGLLAGLVILPLFAFARARGVRWFGLLLLVPLGALAPWTYLALGSGQTAAAASVPFVAACAFCLLVTGRDRGWWALAVLHGAAAVALAGPFVLVPLACLGGAWAVLRATTYEHLSATDRPVGAATPIVASVVAIVALVVSSGRAALTDPPLRWERLHDSLLDAIVAWPFAWIDERLEVVGPATPVEYAAWSIGPALLLIATTYAVVRNERRELAVLAGCVASIFVGMVLSLINRAEGIALVEYTWLATSPLLAALAIRAVALARAAAAERAAARADGPIRAGQPGRTAHRGRYPGRVAARLARLGPTLLVLAFAVLSLAATTATGTRMVHAPSFSNIDVESGRTLIAAGDPWLAFVLDGEAVADGPVDADQLTAPDPKGSLESLTSGSYDRVVVSSSPIWSDPPLSYRSSPALDAYAARLFVGGETEISALGTSASLGEQRTRLTRDDPDAPTRDPGTPPPPLAHLPVEAGSPSGPGDAAGILLPDAEIEGCALAGTDPTSDGPPGGAACTPDAPQVGGDCSAREAAALERRVARGTAPRSSSASNRARPPANNPLATRTQRLRLEDDDEFVPLRPPLLAVACWSVPLETRAHALVVHVRDVGLMLGPRGGGARRSGGWTVTGSGADTRLEGGRRGATVTYGGGSLEGTFDLVLEGTFGAGVAIESTGLPASSGSMRQSVLLGPSAGGMGPLLRNESAVGGVVVRNDRGTQVSLGRLFARPADLPESCDLPVRLAPGALAEVRTETTGITGDRIDRPGLAVMVTGIEQRAGLRHARVVAGTWLSHDGAPRTALIDWTEQYPGRVSVLGCDTQPVSAGPAPARAAERPAEDDPEAPPTEPTGEPGPARAFGQAPPS